MAAGESIRHYLVGRQLLAINHGNTRGLAASFEQIYLNHMLGLKASCSDDADIATTT
jgi:hypothetical protein